MSERVLNAARQQPQKGRCTLLRGPCLREACHPIKDDGMGRKQKRLLTHDENVMQTVDNPE